MTEHNFNVEAIWDAEASVWVATSKDIPGLAAEAPTTEALLDVLRALVPQLLEANGVVGPDDPPDVPFSFHAQRAEVVSRR